MIAMRLHRLAPAIALVGAATLAAQAPRRRPIEVLTLTPRGWTDGGSIPVMNAQPGRDVSPALSWSGVPEGTASFALFVHDVDVAIGNGSDDMLHWMVWNIPATALPEGVPQGGERPDGSRQISASGPYYRGPAAPATGPAHHYVFELFALDTMIGVPAVGAAPAATRAAVVAAMAGHVRGKGAVVGTFRRAAPAAVAPAASPPVDSVPVHDTFTVHSKALGEARPINVYTPTQYRAATGAAGRRFPVLYMPDGGIDEDFPHVARMVDSLAARGVIRPTIVVGVPNTERRRDLTGPTRVASDSAIAPHVGGSAAFRRFFRDELVPEIERRYRTTPERGIIGESLAGLFVVETFLEDPNLFTHYVALDPSVWWNKGTLVSSAGPLIATFDGSARTLYLASSQEPSSANGSAQLAALLRTARPTKLRWTYEPRPDLTHANIFHSLEQRALSDALR
jgi:Raf kinase inhibitor-like YbhB/YbcL family protein